MTAATVWAGQTWRGGLWGGVPQGQRRFRDSSAVALFARMTGLLPSRKELMNTYIAALKTAGVWDKLDVRQITAGSSEVNALLNWKADAINATNNGATFTTNRGFAGDAAATWVSTGFNPTSVAGQYVRDSAHMGFWIETDGADSDGHGAATTAYVRHASGNLTGRINDATTATFGAASATGFHLLVRRGASDKRGFVNGVQVGAPLTTASTGIPNAIAGIGRWNTNATYTDDRVAMFTAGAALSDAEILADYTATRAYMTGIGVA